MSAEVLAQLVWVIAAGVAAYVALDWLRWVRQPHQIGFYWPLLGHIPTLALNSDNMASFFRKAFADRGFTDYILVKAGCIEPPRWIVSTIADTEHVLKTKFESYEAAVGLRGTNFRDFLGDGIFNSDGHQWLLQRKLA
eukprot:CAMPEP_0174845592 /NCGR_PEP_ID=MMETSP1114-20130205/11819_1 /TAXON_ID=312471 /ORGANISM="Neobodo designis, Strain CCAP 1951/1" /LENGTH=137 /DNA_ID=CAMNT_0016079841 /DNA_START=30 /DNA_END=439 /DNA_ORIENTATION=+